MSTPHFRTIEIRAFRGLRDVRLEGLSRVNLIAGRNNAGKTSVLEAIAACCHPVNGDRWIASLWWRSVDVSRRPLDDQFAWLFPRRQGDTPPYRLELAFEAGAPPGRWVVTGELTQRLEIADGGAGDPIEAGGSPTTIVSAVRLAVQSEDEHGQPEAPARSTFELRRGATVERLRSSVDARTLTLTPVVHRNEEFMIKGLARLADSSTWASITDLMRLLDPEVERIEVFDPTGTRSSVRIWHRSMGAAPINAFGDGFRRALVYAICMPQCAGGVLLIDEVETAIHYSALCDVFRWLVEAATMHNVQLFITTHSLEAIDAFIEATPETPDTTFFRLYDSGKGTAILRIAEERLRTTRQQLGAEVRG